MEECKRMGIKVLGPDVNEGFAKFSVIPGGTDIRFGMGAIKGVGENTVNNIIEERYDGNAKALIYRYALPLIPIFSTRVDF